MAKQRIESIAQVAGLAAALADEGRLRILHALDSGELCVCQVTELLGLAPSTVSKHLTVLRQAGLVSARKAGRWTYYSLADCADGSPQGQALVWALRCSLSDDQLRLKEIRRMDVEELCCKTKS